MSERTFRLIQGIFLFTALFFDNANMMWAIIIMYLFEGITNWRIPLIVTGLINSGNNDNDPLQTPNARIPYDAERMQRLLGAVFLYTTYFVYPDAAWFGPWFLAVIFTMAGLTNVCPSVMLFRWIGFR